ncbi:MULTISPECIES: DUF2624 domain-containing protein [Bacillaceae]|uniref:DUF2624 domain-containing protein n=1 Tax=Bacillaceae TaxID=186817 RepID=UPI001BDE584F|nr:MULTISPECIES: DUF2624 domain-containing protein [Bacillaceae]MDX8359567.1 DUF2624 domain-containing protein [Cytobacillus sp. IB215316]
MKLFQHVINQKIKHMTVKDLLNYSKQYDIKISKEQARQITELIQKRDVDIFEDKERKKLIKEVAKITNPTVAKKINSFFTKFIQ